MAIVAIARGIFFGHRSHKQAAESELSESQQALNVNPCSATRSAKIFRAHIVGRASLFSHQVSHATCLFSRFLPAARLAAYFFADAVIAHQSHMLCSAFVHGTGFSSDDAVMFSVWASPSFSSDMPKTKGFDLEQEWTLWLDLHPPQKSIVGEFSKYLMVLGRFAQISVCCPFYWLPVPALLFDGLICPCSRTFGASSTTWTICLSDFLWFPTCAFSNLQ